MEHEEIRVRNCLKTAFRSASDIFIDTLQRECEVKVSVDEFVGEIMHHINGNGIKLSMVDYCDVYPYKYVFSYKLI